jgi:hypothetical protein
LLLIYRPEGADERRWTFTPDKLMSSEAEAIEKVTGQTYEEFGQALIKGSMSARRALLWVFLKREDAPLRHSQVDVPVGSVSVDYEPHELQAIRDGLVENRTLPDEDRQAALDALDEMIADQDVEAPKAPASGSDSDG